MLGVALFAGLWYWFVKTDIGYGITHAIRQPLFVALPIGLMMGDLQQALIIGAAIQILYIGLVAAGSNLPADDALAGLIAIPLALATDLSPALAVAIAVPIGIFGVFIDQLRKTVNIVFVHMADKYAANANTRGIFLTNFVFPTAFQFFLRFPIVFIAVLFGADAVEGVLNALPAWLLNGFSVAGGLLPALGFALVIFVIGRRDLLPWFFIGYFLVAYTSIPVLGAAIFGICIVLLIAGYTRTRNVSAAEASTPPRTTRAALATPTDAPKEVTPNV